MRGIFRILFWFLCGAVFYPSLEVLYRGYSHYSMALCGGLCAVLICYLNGLFPTLFRGVRVLCGTFFMCLAEFIFGVVFNLFLGMDVWDYSHMRYHLLGQVSLSYTLLWCVFSLFLTLFFEQMWKEKNSFSAVYKETGERI